MTTAGGPKGKKDQASIKDDIPDRPRSVVMGIILHQVEGSSSQIATAVVVDRFGEVMGHWNFSKLAEPRSMSGKQKGEGALKPALNEEEELRRKKILMSNKEEEAEHKKDVEKLKTVIQEFDVDLIVLGANSLDARRVKKTLDSVSESLKTFGKVASDAAIVSD